MSRKNAAHPDVGSLFTSAIPETTLPFVDPLYSVTDVLIYIQMASISSIILDLMAFLLSLPDLSSRSKKLYKLNNYSSLWK